MRVCDVDILDGTRAAHGELLGVLAGRTAVELGGTAVQGLLDRNGDGTSAIDWMCLGNSVHTGVGQVPECRLTGRSGR
jgi:acetyl-CoA C-acetyltransferase